MPFPSLPMRQLVSEAATRSNAKSDGLQWLLNLDQVESGTGRVLQKVRVPHARLGSSTHHFERGTVLYSKLRPYLNKVVVADEAGFATTELIPIRCKPDRVDPFYLGHFLRSPRFLAFASAVVSGAKMPRMVMSEFWSYEVPLPALADQRRIAAILDQADALRAKRREALAQLGSLTQSIFIEMFGDPVTGAKGCTPKTLAQCVEKLEYGPRFYNEAYSSDGVRIVRITDLNQSGTLDFESMPRMEVDESTKQQFVLQPGDLVFARTGATVGKVALVGESDPPCIAGAYFIRLRFSELIEPLYAFSVLRAKSVQELIAKQSRQAAQQNFSGPGLRALPMPVPPKEKQKSFVTRVKKIQVERKRAEESLAEMNALFASLQHRAFRGEL